MPAPGGIEWNRGDPGNPRRAPSKREKGQCRVTLRRRRSLCWQACDSARVLASKFADGLSRRHPHCPPADGAHAVRPRSRPKQGRGWHVPRARPGVRAPVPAVHSGVAGRYVPAGRQAALLDTRAWATGGHGTAPAPTCRTGSAAGRRRPPGPRSGPGAPAGRRALRSGSAAARAVPMARRSAHAAVPSVPPAPRSGCGAGPSGPTARHSAIVAPARRSRPLRHRSTPADPPGPGPSPGVTTGERRAWASDARPPACWAAAADDPADVGAGSTNRRRDRSGTCGSRNRSTASRSPRDRTNRPSHRTG